MENEKEQTSTFNMGRFAISVPGSMQFRGGAYQLRLCELREVEWPDEETGNAVERTWKNHLDGIKKIEPPKGKKEVIIDTIEFSDIGRWCKGVFYRKEPKDPSRAYIDILVDAGTTGLWIEFSADAHDKEKIIKFTSKIAKAYRPPARKGGKAATLENKDAFYLEHGAIDLPYKYKESVDIGFKGHALDEHIELDIETDIAGEVEQVGMVDKFKAMIITNYAPGLKIEKIRSQKRTLAGMKGEEVIFKGTEEGEQASGLYFKWEFPGKENDPRFPNFIIDMQAEDDDQRNEKIAIWDSILNSLKPAGR